MGIPGGKSDLVVTVRILTVQDGRAERGPLLADTGLDVPVLGVQVVHAGGSVGANDAAQVLTQAKRREKQARADMLDVTADLELLVLGADEVAAAAALNGFWSVA